MTELERALLTGSEEEGDISSQTRRDRRRLRLPSVLSVRSVTGLLLSAVLMILLFLYVQLEVSHSGHAITIPPIAKTGGAAVSWVRNMHGEYSVLSSPEKGYNFSQAASLCQSLHAHLPFIENKDEEKELVVGSSVKCRLTGLKSNCNAYNVYRMFSWNYSIESHSSQF